jgi:hypothetical protein
MDGIIKFELPEEQDEFEMAIKATTLFVEVWDFLANGHRRLNEDSPLYDGFVEAQKVLRDALMEKNIDIDKQVK